ncbi:tol-pal system protein YbgF [Chlorobium sp. N1]|uniref:tol-pal system protein YbgF n=1 Tax=Chlorobium sp. N1 TaxID=2491138 RepID=UPI001F609629|nr:tol-pal system protein YbgF [Chlorobium sp. N1]
MITKSGRFLLVPFLFLSACASKQDLVVVKDNLETIKTQSAGSYTEMQQIRDRIGSIEGRIDESTYRSRSAFQRLGAEDSLLVQKSDELERRIRAVERYLGLTPPPKEAVSVPAAMPAAAADSVAAAPPDSAAAMKGAPVAVSQAPAPKNDSDLFNEGAAMFGKERYADARERFSALVREYPKSSRAGDAQFFIAESWFAEKAYDKAILDYQTVIAKYTKSAKRPAAIYKQARSFELIGDTTNAKTRYRDLVNVYPQAPEAKLARQKLN